MIDDRNDTGNGAEGESLEQSRSGSRGQGAFEAGGFSNNPASTTSPAAEVAEPEPTDDPLTVSDASPESGTATASQKGSGAGDIAATPSPNVDPPVLRLATEAQEAPTQPDQHVAATSASPAMPAGQGFVWHPVYSDRTYDDVRATLTEDIARDQRTYELAMAGAEGSEHDALKSVVDLERRWSPYDFDWVEANPAELAGRILAFEQDREHRQEMRSFADYRTSGALHQPSAVDPPPPTRSLPIVPIGVGLLVLLILIFILFAVR